jgi:hypothetical protein
LFRIEYVLTRLTRLNGCAQKMIGYATLGKTRANKSTALVLN